MLCIPPKKLYGGHLQYGNLNPLPVLQRDEEAWSSHWESGPSSISRILIWTLVVSLAPETICKLITCEFFCLFENRLKECLTYTDYWTVFSFLLKKKKNVVKSCFTEKGQSFHKIRLKSSKKQYLPIYLNTKVETDDFFAYFKTLLFYKYENISTHSSWLYFGEWRRTGDGASLTSRCLGFTYITPITQAWPGQCFQMMSRESLQVPPQLPLLLSLTRSHTQAPHTWWLDLCHLPRAHWCLGRGRPPAGFDSTLTAFPPVLPVATGSQ